MFYLMKETITVTVPNIVFHLLLPNKQNTKQLHASRKQFLLIIPII